MNNKERARLTQSLFALYGLWHTFDQWSRVLIPFTQWHLNPRPDINGILAFNTLSTAFVLLGSLFFAQLVATCVHPLSSLQMETYGYRRTAIVATLATAFYQAIIAGIESPYIYGFTQSLLVFSNLPMIVDSSIVHVVGEDGDAKQRTRLITKLVIPLSLAYAAGPYIALQIIWYVTSEIHTSQVICGVLHALCIIPIAITCLPDNPQDKPLKAPQFDTYKQLLAQPRTLWALALLMLVTGPYSAYDQVIRVQIANTILLEPNKMTSLFIILGGTTIFVNIFLLPQLQKKSTPQQILMGAFGALIFSYLYLSRVDQYEYLLIGMPIQVAAVSICIGELSSQIFTGVGKGDASKVAAILRVTTLLAQIMTPILCGYYIEADETRLLCYVSAFLSICSMGILYQFGSTMKTVDLSLPIDGGKFEGEVVSAACSPGLIPQGVGRVACSSWCAGQTGRRGAQSADHHSPAATPKVRISAAAAIATLFLFKTMGMDMAIDRKQRVMLVLMLIYALWHMGTQWTTTLLAFIQWDTVEVMTIVDLGYIQSFGSLCNAIGALAFGQLADTAGPKTMFLMSCVFTCLYYMGISLANCWYSFFFIQLLRIGYQLDSTAEMYLATVTTERERTGALMRLTFPQAAAMFVGPIIGSKIAAYTSLRISQFICGVAMFVTLTPVLMFFLPTTHSIPKLATARLRPQDYWPMITKNSALKEGLILRAMVVAAYVCFEMISRNFMLRSFMKDSNDSAIVLLVMATALLLVQFFFLPFLQKIASPRSLLQIALISLTVSYGIVAMASSFNQLLLIIAVQTGAYAIAYAESSTQITSAVEMSDLGKATGLASMAQWMVHFLVPLYTSQLVAHLHYTYAFYTSALLTAVTLVYVTVFAKNTNARLGTLLPSLTVTY